MNGSLLAVVAASAVFSACAQPSTAPLAWPVLAKLRVPSTEGEAIARQASLIAGVPVRYRAATSPHWHALTLLCPTVPVCEAALQRMAQDTATYAALEADAVRRAPPLTVPLRPPVASP